MKHSKLIVWFAVLAGAAMFGSGPRAEGPAPADPARDYFRSPAFTTPMLSVELQYFRVPRDRWDLMLTRMAQHHATTISTYVHWGFHEYEEGKFDFTGSTLPERDLVGFIELCRARGFFVVLKPGPFIDAETLAGGIPGWLLETYPETIARNSRGEPMIHGDSGLPRTSYLHPQYLKLVNRYYRELGREVSRFQWPDGPIIAVQVDNETPGDGFTNLSNYLGMNFKADYNDYYVDTAWPEWLEQRYGTISKLNEAYGSAYGSFAEAPMLREWTDPRDAQAFQIYIDLDRFAEWQYVDALRRYTGMLREAGFATPAYQDLLCMPWDLAGMIGDMGGMAEAVGGWIGSNVYAEVYRLWTIFTGNLAYKYNWDEYAHMAVWRTRLSGTLSEPYPAFVPEITCSERFYFQAPIAWGADAMNVYVGWQTAKDNELTSPKGSWGMEACVTAEGEVRDCLWNAKCTYLFMERAGGFLPGAERPEVAIAYSREPEHAWNWEFKFNFNRPDKKPKLKSLQQIVAGTNNGDQGQLIARQLILDDVDFDVVHLDHLKAGQADRYDFIIDPAAFSPEQLIGADGKIRWRRAWADSSEVDVTERCPAGFEAGAGPCIVSVVNRSSQEFDDPVYFRSGRETLGARLGPKAIGFVSVENGGIRGAVLDHARGRGEVEYGDDRVGFSGSFAAVVNQGGSSLITAVDAGEVVIVSKFAPRPMIRLVRVLLDGRTMEEDFSFEPKTGRIAFNYKPGAGPDRTDLYAVLGADETLESALGAYLSRLGRSEIK